MCAFNAAISRHRTLLRFQEIRLFLSWAFTDALNLIHLEISSSSPRGCTRIHLPRCKTIFSGENRRTPLKRGSRFVAGRESLRVGELKGGARREVTTFARPCKNLGSATDCLPRGLRCSLNNEPGTSLTAVLAAAHLSLLCR